MYNTYHVVLSSINNKVYTSSCVSEIQNITVEDDSVLDDIIDFIRRTEPYDISIYCDDILNCYDRLYKLVTKATDLFNINRVSYSRIRVFVYNPTISQEFLEKLSKLQEVCIYLIKSNHDTQEWGKILKDLSEYKIVFKIKPNDVQMPNYRCRECSLCSQIYNEFYSDILICGNGDFRFIKSYPIAVSPALANLYEDEEITTKLLVEREKQLHKFLVDRNLLCEDNRFMGREVCSCYSVTKEGIYKDGENIMSEEVWFAGSEYFVE